MQIKHHVIFDFDGTMIHSNRAKEKAFFDIVNDEASNDVVRSILKKGKALSWDRFEIIKEISTTLNLKYNILADHYDTHSHKMLLECEKRKGIDEFLVSCVGLKIINSATPTSQLKKVVNEIFYDESFDVVLGDGAGRKIMNLNSLMDRFLLTPESTIIIGDGQDDYDLAKYFSCTFFGFKGGSIHSDCVKLYNTYFEIIDDIKSMTRHIDEVS